ncbi:MAG: putative baseplate assembly protein, partial [Proteobacteria bacterium]|nr:putative baseplate assembly protein [Pseudomonadota bacterium]
FYASTPRSRHYRLDRLNGRVRFGDGTRGMMVPFLDQNVRTTRYCVGGGVKGNIGANQATTIRQAIAYIDGVTNHYAAAGGSDVETIDSVKQRGPYVIKSRYRAVTQEDFEVLALQSSNAIARTTCLPSTEREGEVCIVVVPKFDAAKKDYAQKLVPTTELLRRVKAYLDERRLITVKVNVERPQYTELSINLEIIRTSTGASDRLKRDIEVALRRFLHPVAGGRDGKGWPFGRGVFKVDLFHTIEEVDGVDFVDRIQIFDEDRGIYVDQIKLGPKGLPYLVNLDITEKTRERIV